MRKRVAAGGVGSEAPSARGEARNVLTARAPGVRRESLVKAVKR